MKFSLRPKFLRQDAAVALLTFGCVLLVGGDLFRSWQERNVALDVAHNEVAAVTNSLAADGASVILAADIVLAEIVGEIQTDSVEPSSMARLQHKLRERSAMIGKLEGFYVYDEKGYWLVNPGSDHAPAYTVADRSYFAFHRDHADTKLHVGLPLRGRSTDHWILPLTRRINRPDGSFAGVALAAILIDQLLAEYATLQLGPEGVVTVFNDDGQLLLRQPPVDAFIGSISPSWAAFGALLATSRTGVLEAKSTFDGVDRILGYHRLADYPAVIVVGLGRRDVLAAWHHNAVMHLLGMMCIAGLIAAMGWLALHFARRRSAAEFAASEINSEFRLLAENVNDLIVRVHGRQRVYVSPSCQTLLGYVPVEWRQRRTDEDIHPEDAPRVAAQWATISESSGADTLTYRLRRCDGRYIWVETTARVLQHSANMPAETLFVIRDITDRQEVARQLQESNRLLRRAEAIAHIGHWRREFGSESVLWSDEVYRIHGRTPGEAVTRAIAISAHHPEDREKIAALVLRTVETGEPYSCDVRLVRPDGSICQVIMNGELELAEDGKPIALIGTFQDVTESREMETELRHRQQLDAIGHLAAGVAHDFNNILQVMMTGLELVLEAAPESSDIRKPAEIALASGRRGATLTDELLSFGRRQMLLPRPVSVSMFLAEFSELLSRTLGKHIEVQTELAPSTPDVFVDVGHLHTALLNLAINASAAMREGGRLLVEASVEPDPTRPEGWVIIALEDNGVGMDAVTLKQATEPFFTTKGAEGTGLGLPMVLGFARQSGGDLRLSSSLGKGTRVEIKLPGYAGEVSAEPGLASTTGKSVGRILLIDDMPELLISMSHSLERVGFAVTNASSGDAGLVLLAEDPNFDAIVTDYAMPGLNGAEVVKRAREMRPHLPAILVTGYADVDAAEISGLATVLRKPFERADLVNALQRLLDV